MKLHVVHFKYAGFTFNVFQNVCVVLLSYSFFKLISLVVALCVPLQLKFVYFLTTLIVWLSGHFSELLGNHLLVTFYTFRLCYMLFITFIRLFMFQFTLHQYNFLCGCRNVRNDAFYHILTLLPKHSIPKINFRLI